MKQMASHCVHCAELCFSSEPSVMSIIPEHNRDSIPIPFQLDSNIATHDLCISFCNCADFCRINFQKQENWVIRWKYLESCIAIATWFPLRTILFAHPQKFTKLPVSQQFHQQSTDDPWTMLLIFQSLSRFYSMKICRELTAVLPTLC